eukprot:SAG31_NODE_19797_length_591_cov_1.048780_1_plen_129_part_10
MRILDLAGGTGDIAFRCATKLRQFNSAVSGTAIIVSDINEEMLDVGRQRALDSGAMQPQGPVSIEWDWVAANAESLPFAGASFDAVTIAFGIRNVTRIDEALHEAHRVLRPGGRFLCLEFGPNVEPLPL